MVGGGGLVAGFGVGGVEDWEEGMGTAFALVDAAGAEAPFAFVTGVAFPEAVVAECGAV